jgi:uncharacterized protein YdiU (UPF0061 family)
VSAHPRAQEIFAHFALILIYSISILGLTIDYGPYAFMDVFDPNHICNHTDESGRYSYKYQPNMIIYALRALLNALVPLIGAEKEFGSAIEQGWTSEVSKEKIAEWTKSGLELKDEVERIAQQTAADEYGRIMRKVCLLSSHHCVVDR